MIEPLAREVLTTVESMVCERVPERVRAGWQAVVADVDRAAREGRESAGWLAVQYLCRGDARLEQLGESEAGGERAEELRGEGGAGSVCGRVVSARRMLWW